jgi:hypothetical protein
MAIMTINQLQEAINDLNNIAFYFLLRVGEYTHVSSKKRTLTIQFRVQDITLWCNTDELLFYVLIIGPYPNCVRIARNSLLRIM